MAGTAGGAGATAGTPYERPGRIVRETVLRRVGWRLRALHLTARLDDQGRVAEWVAWAQDADGREIRAAGDDPATAIRQVLGCEDRQQCLTCLLIKPLAEFSKHKRAANGRCSACKSCERIRKALYDRESGKVRDDQPSLQRRAMEGRGA